MPLTQLCPRAGGNLGPQPLLLQLLVMDRSRWTWDYFWSVSMNQLLAYISSLGLGWCGSAQRCM